MIHSPFDQNEFVKIGSGGFGMVFKARHKIDNHCYAIKVIPYQDPEKSAIVLKEVQSLSSFHHPNIIRYFNCWIDKFNGNSELSLQDSQSESLQKYHECSDKCALFIQTELMDMTLREYIDSNPSDQEEKKRILSSICNAVFFLHKNGIVHCDIKPSNILLKRHNGDIEVKLSDFGLVNFIGQVNPQLQYYGTEFYMHPSLINDIEPRPNEETDLYALLIVGHELMNTTETRMESVKQIELFKKKIDLGNLSYNSFNNIYIKQLE